MSNDGIEQLPGGLNHDAILGALRGGAMLTFRAIMMDVYGGWNPTDFNLPPASVAVSVNNMLAAGALEAVDADRMRIKPVADCGPQKSAAPSISEGGTALPWVGSKIKLSR